MIAQTLRQTAAIQIPKYNDCQAYPVYLLLHRKLFRITIDMKRKKKSMFKWYLSVSDLFIEGLGLSFYGSYSDVDNNSTDTTGRANGCQTLPPVQAKDRAHNSISITKNGEQIPV